jgi:hypothetical protein
MRNILFLVIFAVITLYSCSGNKKPEDAVARVYDDYLTASALEGIVPEGIYGEDSLQVIRDYMNSWIRQKLILRHAEKNLNKDQKDFTKQLEDYRNSLIIFTYEQELVRQKLDTLVNDKEIIDYYEQNKSDFELKDNIVKVWYVKLRKDSPLAQFRLLIRSDKPGDFKKLTDLCAKNAVNSFLDDGNWLLFNDILKEIPIKTYNQEEYLKNNRFIEIQDSAFTYMLNIKGFMIKESESPLGFEKENIRSIIINKRKLKLISDMQDGLYKNAAGRDFEILIK